MMMSLFCKLLLGHFVADYPLQGDFLAKSKNHKLPISGVPFYQALFAHSAIHAGSVWLITGNGYLAVCELVLHATIDYLKCDGRLSFNQDQIAHVICKLGYVCAVAL